MKKFLSILVLCFIFASYINCDQLFKLPKDETGVKLQNISLIGTQYKLISETTAHTAVSTGPSAIYGVMFSSAANSNDYVVLYDSTTASTAGQICEVVFDTNTYVGSINARIVMFANPIQTTKGIYSDNSAVTFKSTILYRNLWQ